MGRVFWRLAVPGSENRRRPAGPGSLGARPRSDSDAMGWPWRRGGATIAAVWLGLGTGCSSDPRSELLEQVAAAIAAQDEATFLRWAITTADIDLRAQGVSPFQA